MHSVVTRHEDSGLDLIAAPSDPGVADRVPAAVVEELLRVARANHVRLRHRGHPAKPSPNTSSPRVTLSDLTLLIATLDIPAVKNLRIAISTLDTLGASNDTRIIVLNRSDAKVGLKADDVESALNTPIAASVPNSLRSRPRSIGRADRARRAPQPVSRRPS